MFRNPYESRRSREATYGCFICGGEGRASSMTTVRADNPILYGPYVTVHRGSCLDKYRRRHS